MLHDLFAASLPNGPLDWLIWLVIAIVVIAVIVWALRLLGIAK